MLIAGIGLGYQWADNPTAGASVIVTTDGDPVKVRRENPHARVHTFSVLHLQSLCCSIPPPHTHTHPECILTRLRVLLDWLWVAMGVNERRCVWVGVGGNQGHDN